MNKFTQGWIAFSRLDDCNELEPSTEAPQFLAIKLEDEQVRTTGNTVASQSQALLGLTESESTKKSWVIHVFIKNVNHDLKTLGLRIFTSQFLK